MGLSSVVKCTGFHLDRSSGGEKIKLRRGRAENGRKIWILCRKRVFFINNVNGSLVNYDRRWMEYCRFISTSGKSTQIMYISILEN